MEAVGFWPRGNEPCGRRRSGSVRPTPSTLLLDGSRKQEGLTIVASRPMLTGAGAERIQVAVAGANKSRSIKSSEGNSSSRCCGRKREYARRAHHHASHCLVETKQFVSIVDKQVEVSEKTLTENPRMRGSAA
jgi:hypothetical protein